jgi:hypothetical protein
MLVSPAAADVAVPSTTHGLLATTQLDQDDAGVVRHFGGFAIIVQCLVRGAGGGESVGGGRQIAAAIGRHGLTLELGRLGGQGTCLTPSRRWSTGGSQRDFEEAPRRGSDSLDRDVAQSLSHAQVRLIFRADEGAGVGRQLQESLEGPSASPAIRRRDRVSSERSQDRG